MKKRNNSVLSNIAKRFLGAYQRRNISSNQWYEVFKLNTTSAITELKLPSNREHIILAVERHRTSNLHYHSTITVTNQEHSANHASIEYQIPCNNPSSLQNITEVNMQAGEDTATNQATDDSPSRKEYGDVHSLDSTEITNHDLSTRCRSGYGEMQDSDLCLLDI